MLFRADARSAKLKPLQVAAPDIEAWLLAKEPRALDSYLDLAPEEYARAFTAARTAGTDVADDLYFALVDNVARHGDEADFAKLVIPTLKAKGWLGGDAGEIASRVRLIYDSNLRLARAAGRWESYQAAKQALPYVRGVTAHDERVRHPPKSPKSDHRAFDGIILPLDHPFVAEYWTPLGFRCRCIWVQMSRSELARYAGGITSEEELQERRLRLGPPVFSSPAAPIADQLAAMVEPSNSGQRMPGLPKVDPGATEAAGRSIWDEVLRAQHLSEVGKRLASAGFV